MGRVWKNAFSLTVVWLACGLAAAPAAPAAGDGGTPVCGAGPGAGEPGGTQRQRPPRPAAGCQRAHRDHSEARYLRRKKKRRRPPPTPVETPQSTPPSAPAATASPSGPTSSPAIGPNLFAVCELAPGGLADLELSVCSGTPASDTASNTDPLPFWGRMDCASSSRHQRIESGGDPHPTGLGLPQGDGSFRRLTAFDGDLISSGERCELGYNWHSTMDDGRSLPKPGPTVFYREGQRRVTFASIRLPSSSDVNNPNWRNVLQMKQAQPYANPEPSSVLELQVRGGQWIVNNSWNEIWTAPASQNTWTRFAFDITYSQDPAIGSIKIYVDLNGDGDAADANEQSPTMHRQTLKREVAGGPSLPAGASIPSHLRAGIYQNEIYSCPTGCSVDIDNVQVVGVIVPPIPAISETTEAATGSDVTGEGEASPVEPPAGTEPVTPEEEGGGDQGGGGADQGQEPPGDGGPDPPPSPVDAVNGTVSDLSDAARQATGDLLAGGGARASPG